ncbi:MAG: type II secretion system minor pseudopilin GspI [Phenylobacterium sp.]|uniref:type II secretion system minor pseudopilin GspI n=1 Tax=Phenylobacterium sp. TaxID=1871053 RepID=UPI003BB615F4
MSRRAEGFTLIELLVALAVFSLAVVALLNLAGENIRAAAAMEERTFATVVAENRAVELLTQPDSPTLGADRGAETAGDRTWTWTQRVSRTADQAMVRIDVRVARADGDRTLGEVTVFRGRQ